MASKKALPWRFQTDDATGFDELVVGIGGKPCLLHAEMMDERSIFVTIANLKVWAYVDRDGNAHVSMTEDEPAAPTPKGRSVRNVAQKLYDEFKGKGQLAGQRQRSDSEAK